jgi:hypothetical protein
MITFVGMSSRTSGYIRGIQMSQRLPGGQFVELYSRLPAINDIVIFQRNYSQIDARYYKSRGHIIGYDIADMPVGDAVFRGKHVDSLKDYTHAECDFFIVNNTLQKSDVDAVSSKPSYVIPHHTTNFDNLKAQFRDETKTVGYVGLPEQLSAVDDIQKMCSAWGAAFISVHPTTREECDIVFRKIDIGIVFSEHDGRMNDNIISLMKRYKPNTKLSNFQSYGIPSICIPYESYLEFGENACLFVNDKESMLAQLNVLLSKDPSSRRELSDRAFEVGKKFHIDNIKKLYENINKDFSK